MDTGTAIIGAIIIIICLAPFVIIYYKRVKKEKKVLQSLEEVARQHNCSISQHEFCGDFVVGIDDNRKWVFFHKQKEGGAVTQHVDLAKIGSCKVVKKYISSKNGHSGPGSLERVDIGFISNNHNKGETRFEMYNDEENIQLSGEVEFAEKWSNLINDLVKSR